MICHR